MRMNRTVFELIRKNASQSVAFAVVPELIFTQSLLYAPVSSETTVELGL